MKRDLPPLPALRSFEASARTLSFRQAADLLSITPSAVSHAVQNLEKWLGVKLFHRHSAGRRGTRALVLTDAGKAFLPAVRLAFDEIEQAARQIRESGAADILTVGCAPIFAKSWLVPRLATFLEDHPDVDIRVISTLEPGEQLQGRFDVGLLYGRGKWPGLVSDLVLPEVMMPVCSPTIISDDKPLISPEDLNCYPLIHSEARLTDWSMWADQVGVKLSNNVRGIHFNRSALAIDAAVNGLGIALEGRTAVRDHLRDGSLITPFETLATPWQGGGYYFTSRESEENVPKIQAFRAWVIREVALEAGDNLLPA